MTQLCYDAFILTNHDHKKEIKSDQTIFFPRETWIQRSATILATVCRVLRYLEWKTVRKPNFVFKSDQDIRLSAT